MYYVNSESLADQANKSRETLIPLTHTQEICMRNLHICHAFLVQVFSCTSFLLWTWNIALICTSWYMNLHKLVSKFDSRNVCKHLVQVSEVCVKGIRQTSDLNRISVKYSIRMLYWIMELICVLSVSIIYYRKNIPTSSLFNLDQRAMCSRLCCFSCKPHVV